MCPQTNPVCFAYLHPGFNWQHSSNCFCYYDLCSPSRFPVHILYGGDFMVWLRLEFVVHIWGKGKTGPIWNFWDYHFQDLLNRIEQVGGHKLTYESGSRKTKIYYSIKRVAASTYISGSEKQILDLDSILIRVETKTSSGYKISNVAKPLVSVLLQSRHNVRRGNNSVISSD